MKKHHLQALIILFGLFYLFSGIIKIIDIDDFLFLMRQYRFKPFIYLAPIIPVLEIFIGLFLILRIALKQTIAFSMLLLLGFTIIFSFGHFYFKIDDCGCFGGVEFLKMSPSIFYLRNGLLLFLSYLVYSKLEKTQQIVKPLYFTVIILLIAAGAYMIGEKADLNKYLQQTPYTRENINNYQDSFINKHVQNTILGNYITTNPDSSYLIFIFSFDCPHCMVSSVRLNEYIDNNIVDKIVGITKGTRAKERFFNENIPLKFNYRKIKNIEMNEITGFYPLSFYIENDTVRFKVKGALPEYEQFIQKYLSENKNPDSNIPPGSK